MTDELTYATRYVGPFVTMAKSLGVSRDDLIQAAVLRLLECRKKHKNPPEHTEKAYMRGAILMEIRFWRYGKHHRKRMMAEVLEDFIVDDDDQLSILDLGRHYHDGRPIGKKKRRTDPAFREKERLRGRAYRERVKKDPVRMDRIRRLAREAYQRRKHANQNNTDGPRVGGRHPSKGRKQLCQSIRVHLSRTGSRLHRRWPPGSTTQCRHASQGTWF